MFDITTTYGYWNALAFAFALFIALLISGALNRWARANAFEYDKGVDKGKVYLSGEDEPANRELHFSSQNLYWGFSEALMPYYKPVRGEHSGILNVYSFWLVVTLAMVLLVIILVGGR